MDNDEAESRADFRVLGVKEQEAHWGVQGRIPDPSTKTMEAPTTANNIVSKQSVRAQPYPGVLSRGAWPTWFRY